MSYSKRYSTIDRLLHHVAFLAPFVQKTLHELDNDIFKRQFEDIETEREVFVTGLPRSGTTLILELLYETGEFRTFSYRNMPFILAPLLWNRISKPFQKRGITMERAHADGMEISFDSPEAFEEVIWLTYMKEKIVTGDTLSTLSVGDETPEFTEAIQSTVRKLLLEKNVEGASQPRYLSKNNVNFARIELITKLFPSSTILIPFRNPMAHVSSMMKQHEQFLAHHQEDSFSRRYMEWLGHYDFGDNFKPINFDNWVDREQEGILGRDTNFRIKYWVAAYSYVADHMNNNVYLVDYDKLLKDSRAYLHAIAKSLGLNNKEKLIEASDKIRTPTSKPLDATAFLQENLQAAQDLHGKLSLLAL